MTKQSNRKRVEEAYEMFWQHVFDYCKEHLPDEQVTMGEAATIAANIICHSLDEYKDQGLTSDDVVIELEEVRSDT